MAVTADVAVLNKTLVTAGVAVSCAMQCPFATWVQVCYGPEDTQAVYNVDFTVTLAGDFLSFTITPAASLMTKLTAAGSNDVRVKRVVPLTSDFVEGDAFVRRKIRDITDKIFMAAQQLSLSASELLTRTLHVPVGETVDAIPNAATRANKYLAFDADGNPVAVNEGEGDFTKANLDGGNTFTGLQFLNNPTYANFVINSPVGGDFTFAYGGVAVGFLGAWTSDALRIQSNVGKDIVFETNANNERMRITTSGDISFQQTPTAPTRDAGNNGNSLATTAYVTRASLVRSSAAALRALTASTFAGGYIYLSSYYAAASYADGIAKGAGWYAYDAADTTSADDSATVIVDASGRRWKLQHQGTVKLSQCGGLIDGTDDLAAINRGIALLNANVGVVTLLSDPGTVGLSATPNPLTRANRSILGAGINSSTWTMLASAGATATFLQIGTTATTCQRFTVAGMGFVHSNTPGAGPTVDFKNSSMCVAERLYFNSINSAFRFGGTAAGETSIRTTVSDCIGQVTLVAASAVIELLSSNAVQFNNCIFTGTTTGVTTARLVKIAPSALGDGVDNAFFSNVTLNFNATEIDYGIEFDATNPSIANVRFSNCTLDGGLQYAHLYKVGAGTNARIYNCGFTNCRISASTNHASEGGGGVHILHENDSYIHGIQYAGNCFSIGSKNLCYHQRTGGVDVNATGFTFTGNSFSNKYSNADTLGTTRAVFRLNGNGFVIVGNRVGAQAEDVDDATGANFFTSFVTFDTASITNCVIEGNDVARITNTYPVDVAALSAAGAHLGPRIANNAGKPENPLRTVQTTDATVANLGTVAVANSTTVRISGRVVGKGVSATEASYSFWAVASAAAGVATLHASGITVEYELNAAYALTVDANSGNIRVRVTGAAATTINWGLFDVKVEIL